MLREEEIPIEWSTTNGTRVTGRPDIVICMEERRPPVPLQESYKRTPVLGLELKSVHSLWVARDVLFGRKPKLDNLVQAAHYMWKLGVPWKLLYQNYSQLGQGMAGNEWITKQFPRPGEPGSDYIEYTIQKKDPRKYSIKHVKQFEVVYDLRFTPDGMLQFKLEQESDTQWTDTVVTIDSIQKYFEYVSQMESKQELAPRPLTLAYDGSELSYSLCDPKYCPLAGVCDSTEKLGYSKWFEQVTKTIEESKLSHSPVIHTDK